MIQQLNYEKKVEEQRMRAEISQAKRQADFFAEQVEKGEQLKKLEEKVGFESVMDNRSVIWLFHGCSTTCLLKGVSTISYFSNV